MNGKRSRVSVIACAAVFRSYVSDSQPSLSRICLNLMLAHDGGNQTFNLSLEIRIKMGVQRDQTYRNGTR